MSNYKGNVFLALSLWKDLRNTVSKFNFKRFNDEKYDMLLAIVIRQCL